MSQRPYAEVKAERQAKILDGKQFHPGSNCHMCGWRLPVKGHYCSAACSDDFAAEKAELLARDGK